MNCNQTRSVKSLGTSALVWSWLPFTIFFTNDEYAHLLPLCSNVSVNCELFESSFSEARTFRWVLHVYAAPCAADFSDTSLVYTLSSCGILYHDRFPLLRLSTSSDCFLSILRQLWRPLYLHLDQHFWRRGVQLHSRGATS